MKINVSISDLKNAVSEMDMLIKGGKRLSLLESILITAENRVITLTANNLNIMVSYHIPGEIAIDGRAVLQRGEMALVLKMSGSVTLEFSQNYCTVSGGRLFKFPVWGSTEDFPLMPEIPENEANYSIPENDLLYCLKLKTLMTDRLGKGMMCGIWFDANTIWACDGYRLGKIETEQPAENRFMLTDLAVNYLSKALDKKAGSPVVFYLGEKGCVKARAERFEIVFRQYDCEYKSLIESFNIGASKTATVRKRDLSGAISFICGVHKSCKKNKGPKLNPVVYTFSGENLKLSYSMESTRVEEEIPVTLDNNSDLRIGFDPEDSLELLSLIDGDDLTMSFTSPLSPSVICGKKENEKFLIVPMRMTDAA